MCTDQEHTILRSCPVIDVSNSQCTGEALSHGDSADRMVCRSRYDSTVMHVSVLISYSIKVHSSESAHFLQHKGSLVRKG